MDSYYLNDAVEKLNDFLSKADNPKFTGESRLPAPGAALLGAARARS